MIKNLEVKNFKSIKHLKLDCKRINIFIGKPNTGKSNLLESVGIFSLPYGTLKDFVRYESTANLFYDQDLGEKIEITADDYHCQIKFENGIFKGNIGDKEKKIFHWDFNFDPMGIGASEGLVFPPFKFYKFAVMAMFRRLESNFLLPPKGENLLQILLTNKALRRVAADIFSEFGLKIVLEPYENKIKVQKEAEGVVISYPYSLVSDTLQRIVFYLTAIETNKDSIIIFEEPEAHAFPYYTKFLAERIAMDKTNQYFISTHNPYFLLSILQKTPKNDIGIFTTYFKDYQTKVKALSQKEMTRILDLEANVFFNLDRFLEPE